MESYNEQRIYNNFNSYFSGITDLREHHKIEHLLSEILFISVLAIIAGAEEIQNIEHYAKKKQRWLSTFLTLPNGIPSHDTFNRVLAMINPQEFEGCFISWISDYKNKLPFSDVPDVIALDGKTIRGSKSKSKKTVHMVSALSTKHGLILGQKKCAEKSNEITAIPELLDMIDICKAIITIDAMGCQKKIADKIILKGAQYILALKGNQGNLSKEVEDFFEKTKQDEFKHYIHQHHVETDPKKNHGRIETRECTTITNLDWLYEPIEWKTIKSIVRIKSTVIKAGKKTVEERFYISSLDGDAELINNAVRAHWHIENKLHWVLDVVFREDDCRLRTGNSAESMNIIRKIALNKMKADTSEKCSLKSKVKLCAWDDSYALKIIWQMMG